MLEIAHAQHQRRVYRRAVAQHPVVVCHGLGALWRREANLSRRPLGTSETLFRLFFL